MRIGIDSGGTFTDFVVLRDDGRVETFKLRSSRSAPHEVILAGIARAGHGAQIVHGSTVATNALLERKGARTAFVTTAGFEDLLTIARQNRPRLYDLTPPLPAPLVDPDLAFGVPERTHADGSIERSASPAFWKKLRGALKRSGVESVAICFLHSCQNASNERAAAIALRGVGYVSASHGISPEYREYERASTTVINAYVGPLMDAYLSRLDGHDISILQSNGGSLTATEARRNAVRTILSGPAGGVVGAAALAKRAGFRRSVGFDMGGTSTDVSFTDGEPRVTTEASIGGFPIRVPVLDIHTVGAGGGSIARIDSGGLLRVGPESAGADPGPACYGTGTQPTVTDAHVVLGRIARDQLAGGALPIDPARSRVAIAPLARALKLSVDATAAGILRVVDSHMARAIRVVSVERGEDPRSGALVAFGGCGGLHACSLASELGIRSIVVPEHAGVLSALGMLLAPRIRDYSASVLGLSDCETHFRALEDTARRETPTAKIERFADIRYRGQSYELTVPWQPHNPAAPFHRAHRRAYGASDTSRAIEIVTIRVRATLALARPRLQSSRLGTPHRQTREIFAGSRRRRIAVVNRAAIGSTLRGPALILDYGATTLIEPGWTARLDPAGSLVLTN